MMQSGTVTFTTDFSGWITNPSGADTFVSPDVKFVPPFPSAPSVALSLAGIIADPMPDLKFSLEAFDVETNEFNIRIQRWGSAAVISSLTVTWIAHD